MPDKLADLSLSAIGNREPLGDVVSNYAVLALNVRAECLPGEQRKEGLPDGLPQPQRRFSSALVSQVM